MVILDYLLKFWGGKLKNEGLRGFDHVYFVEVQFHWVESVSLGFSDKNERVGVRVGGLRKVGKRLE